MLCSDPITVLPCPPEEELDEGWAWGKSEAGLGMYPTAYVGSPALARTDSERTPRERPSRTKALSHKASDRKPTEVLPPEPERSGEMMSSEHLTSSRARRGERAPPSRARRRTSSSPPVQMPGSVQGPHAAISSKRGVQVMEQGTPRLAATEEKETSATIHSPAAHSPATLQQEEQEEMDLLELELAMQHGEPTGTEHYDDAAAALGLLDSLDMNLGDMLDALDLNDLGAGISGSDSNSAQQAETAAAAERERAQAQAQQREEEARQRDEEAKREQHAMRMQKKREEAALLEQQEAKQRERQQQQREDEQRRSEQQQQQQQMQMEQQEAARREELAKRKAKKRAKREAKAKREVGHFVCICTIRRIFVRLTFGTVVWLSACC